ncbi:UDP-N-acetylmuramoyl-L-alanyl-D-glutamate--2,6-diaminopimelate ligase [Sessilibacter sp. MAH4]
MTSPLNLSELLADISNLVLPEATAKICPKDLVSDSRKISVGDVFVALAGHQFDGRNYIEQAIHSGAVAVLSEADTKERIKDVGDVSVIEIPNLLQKISFIAAKFFEFPAKSLSIFGVTGTNGKTTCSQLYANARNLLKQPCGVIGTLGAGIFGNTLTSTGFTTPDAISAQRYIAQMSKNISFLSLEVSSHSLDQYRVDSLNFTSALFTNLSRDHLDYHGSMENYIAAKQKLFLRPELQNAIFNIDDSVGETLAAHYQGSATRLTYSVENPKADVYVKNARYHSSGVEGVLVTPTGQSAFSSALIGEFNLSNLLGVIATLLAEDVSFEQVLSVIPELRPVAGRMEVVDNDLRLPTVIVDYAHTPDGLAKALAATRVHCNGELICIFGCGGDRDRGKRKEMAAIAEQYSDQIIVTNDNPRTESPQQIVGDIFEGFQYPENVIVELDRKSAIRKAIEIAQVQDTVLIAGKGHEDYQIVGTERLNHLDSAVAREILSQRAMAL